MSWGGRMSAKLQVVVVLILGHLLYLVPDKTELCRTFRSDFTFVAAMKSAVYTEARSLDLCRYGVSG